jgi:hypothetical protein
VLLGTSDRSFFCIDFSSAPSQNEPERDPDESNATIRSRDKDTGSFAVYSRSLSRISLSSPTILSGDERSRCEIASGVQHRGE